MRTAVDAVRAVSAGEVRPHELLEDVLRVLPPVQRELNAFTLVRDEQARAEARAVPSGGALQGVPVAVKDLFDVHGLATSGCTAPFRDRIATMDSVVVSRLRAAGAIIVAKTNQHELAAGATGLISDRGPAWNPWDPGRIPGGSSSGSAIAVAAGVVPVAIGSDTGGSIRMPCSFCGITGLKPTHGAISMRGAMPLGPGFDVAGPMARTVADCRIVYAVLAGRDPAYEHSRYPERVAPFPGIDRVRIGVPATFLTLTHPETRDAIEAAAATFASIGARVEHIGGPTLDDDQVGFDVVWAAFAGLYPDLLRDERVAPEVRAILRHGAGLSATQRAVADARVHEVRRGFERTFREVDVLLAPATPFPAPRAIDTEVAVDGGTLPALRGGPALRTRPVNEAGLPALSVPVGFSSDGLPIGAQLIGPAWSEEWLFALGEAYQEATDHHLRTPPPVPGQPT